MTETLPVKAESVCRSENSPRPVRLTLLAPPEIAEIRFLTLWEGPKVALTPPADRLNTVYPLSPPLPRRRLTTETPPRC